MSGDIDLVRFVAFVVIIGFPMLMAYFAKGMMWSVQIGTLAAVLQVLMEVGVRE